MTSTQVDAFLGQYTVLPSPWFSCGIGPILHYCRELIFSLWVKAISPLYYFDVEGPPSEGKTTEKCDWASFE